MKMPCILILKSVIYSVLFCGFAFGQDISKEHAIEDLQFLQTQIEKYQPGLSKYAPSFQKDAESLLGNISEDSLTYFEFYEYLHRFCVLSREGHFSVGNWFDTVRKGIPQSTYAYFPADVKAMHGKLYVEEDYSDEQTLTRGSEITRINGKSSAEILQKLFVTIPSDGAIITNIYDELDFSFPYYYYFFVEQPQYFGVTLKDVSGRETTKSIKAITRDEQRLNFRKYILPKRKDIAKENPVYSLDINDTYTQLSLRSFNNSKLDDQKIKARRFYKRIFDTIRKENVENLVIDLRGNSGGLFKMAEELIPYLMEETPEDRFQRKSLSWEGKERSYKFHKKSRKAFEGQVYVLIDGGTFSSASTLARYLKEHSNAILIGEETGSRYEGFVAGSKIHVILPNTGLEVGIPRYLIEFGEGKKQQTSDRGVLPDFTIDYTMQHIISDRDLHLEKTKELIKQREAEK